MATGRKAGSRRALPGNAMRVALDATPLTLSSGGLARYTSELSLALAAEFPEDRFVLVSDQTFTLPPNAPLNLIKGGAPRDVLEQRWWLWGLARELRRQRADLFHGTDFAVPYLPLRPSVMTLHDLSPWMDPSWHSAAARVRRRAPWLIRLNLATMILTDSEAVRRQAIDHFRIHPSRIVAVPLAASVTASAGQTEVCPASAVADFGVSGACSSQSVADSSLSGTCSSQVIADSNPPGTRISQGGADFSLPGHPYFLYVGAIEPRKNLPLLLEAWRPVYQRHAIELWLAGRSRADAPAIPSEPGLRRLGEVADECLAALYSNSLAFVYPSLYEGFGLPVLEAMTCGACVLTSNDPAITEVSGDAAVRLDPRDGNAWTAAMDACAAGGEWIAERRRLSLRRAADFSWARTARLTREVYEEAQRRFRQ